MSSDNPAGKNEFGQALRAARLEAGLTQHQLAEAANISRRTLIRWESGEVSPWIPEVRAALKALGLSRANQVSMLSMLGTNRAQGALDSDQVARQAKLLKMARLRAGLTPAEAANRMDVDISTLARWERGASTPNNSDLERLLETIDLTTRELAEAGAMPSSKETIEASILGIARPWDKQGWGLYDARYLRLLDQLRSADSSETTAQHIAHTQAAYAWVLASCGRHSEAEEHAVRAVGSFEAGEARPSPYQYLALIAMAKSFAHRGSDRGIQRGARTLDGLDGKPLEWKFLACRWDAYSETFARQGSFNKALDFSRRAIEAAQQVGPGLTKLISFNRCRILLLSGHPEKALESFPAFSEMSPLTDAQEMNLLALIYETAANHRQAAHWRHSSQKVVWSYQLERFFRQPPDQVWSMPPLIALCDTF